MEIFFESIFRESARFGAVAINKKIKKKKYLLFHALSGLFTDNVLFIIVIVERTMCLEAIITHFN